MGVEICFCWKCLHVERKVEQLYWLITLATPGSERHRTLCERYAYERHEQLTRDWHRTR